MSWTGLRSCEAGAGCGGCVRDTGYEPKILESTLEERGKMLFTSVRLHFPFSRREVFDFIGLAELKTYEAGAGGAGCVWAMSYVVKIPKAALEESGEKLSTGARIHFPFPWGELSEFSELDGAQVL